MTDISPFSSFAEEYPLLKLFPYGKNDYVAYDAKAHFAFIVSDEDMDALAGFLKNSPGIEPGGRLADRFSEFRNRGVFLKGPVKEVSPVDRNSVEGLLKYYDENILLRKFCLEVTENCNFRCRYCKRTIAADAGGHFDRDLSSEDAFLGIRYYFDKYTSFFGSLPQDKRTLLLKTVPPGLSWYGGEPFLNFDLIKKTAGFFRSLPWEERGIPPESLHFTANTNLSVMSDEILRFLVENDVTLYASLDGPAEEHDRCRVFEDGEGTFDLAFSNLTRIKNHDLAYFERKVSIFGVYTDLHDHHRCVDFNASLGAFRCSHFPAQYTGVFVPEPEKTLADFQRSFGARMKKFAEKSLEESRKRDIDYEYFSGLIAFTGVAFDNPCGKDTLDTALTCPMGFDNLMLAANGDYLICHKSDNSMPIGSCVSGIDLDKLTDLNIKYNSTINDGPCSRCWAVRFCRICAAARMSGDRFVNPSARECEFLRLETAFRFSCFLHLCRKHPEITDKLSGFRNDPNHFIGIIDRNAL
ncbi:MAG: radical SAM protein [Synergistota bacterium]|nr:radical SAM protein [Synergistota bacterium]